MGYTKNTWANGDVISKAKLDHIEDGIYNNAVTQVTVNNGVASFKNAAGNELFTLAVGGSSYVKLGEDDFTVSTTSTSVGEVGSIYVTDTDLWTSAKIIFVCIRDKAGKRQGYFYGSDTLYANPNPVNSSATASIANASRLKYIYNTDGTWSVSNATTGYGVYVHSIYSSGRVRLVSRYSATESLTINGTYHVDVYALAWADGTPLT